MLYKNLSLPLIDDPANVFYAKVKSFLQQQLEPLVKAVPIDRLRRHIMITTPITGNKIFHCGYSRKSLWPFESKHAYLKFTITYIIDPTEVTACGETIPTGTFKISSAKIERNKRNPENPIHLLPSDNCIFFAEEPVEQYITHRETNNVNSGELTITIPLGAVVQQAPPELHGIDIEENIIPETVYSIYHHCIGRKWVITKATNAWSLYDLDSDLGETLIDSSTATPIYGTINQWETQYSEGSCAHDGNYISAVKDTALTCTIVVWETTLGKGLLRTHSHYDTVTRICVKKNPRTQQYDSKSFKLISYEERVVIDTLLRGGNIRMWINSPLELQRFQKERSGEVVYRPYDGPSIYANTPMVNLCIEKKDANPNMFEPQNYVNYGDVNTVYKGAAPNLSFNNGACNTILLNPVQNSLGSDYHPYERDVQRFRFRNMSFLRAFDMSQTFKERENSFMCRAKILYYTKLGNRVPYSLWGTLLSTYNVFSQPLYLQDFLENTTGSIPREVSVLGAFTGVPGSYTLCDISTEKITVTTSFSCKPYSVLCYPMDALPDEEPNQPVFIPLPENTVVDLVNGELSLKLLTAISLPAGTSYCHILLEMLSE